MRTAILLGALIISNAIYPNQVIPTGMGIFIILSLVSFVIMDVVDFFRKL